MTGYCKGASLKKAQLVTRVDGGGRGEVPSFAKYVTPYKILLHGPGNTLVNTVGFQMVAICFCFELFYGIGVVTKRTGGFIYVLFLSLECTSHSILPLTSVTPSDYLRH